MFRNLALLGVLLGAATALGGQNVVVVLDDSGSMSERMRSDRRQTKVEAAKEALLTVLKPGELPPDTKVGIVLLNGDWEPESWLYPLGPVDQAALSRAVRGITASGGTPLGECMKVGADALLSLRAKQQYGSYRLLIVTDGEANTPRIVERHLPDILSRGLYVDVIGVDMARQHSLATRVHTYRRADDPQSLIQAIREVLAEPTGDPGAATETDFEVIAPIPDEVAMAMLEALVEPKNYPIGEAPPPAADRRAGPPPGKEAPVLPGQQEGPPGEQKGGGQGRYVWVLVAVGVVVFFFIARAAAKQKRV
jgi:hypothetical protein